MPFAAFKKNAFKSTKSHCVQHSPPFARFFRFRFRSSAAPRDVDASPKASPPLGSLAHGMVSIRPATIDDLPGMQACVLDAGWGSWVRHDPLEDGVLGCFLDLFGTPTPCHIIICIFYAHLYSCRYTYDICVCIYIYTQV